MDGPIRTPACRTRNFRLVSKRFVQDPGEPNSRLSKLDLDNGRRFRVILLVDLYYDAANLFRAGNYDWERGVYEVPRNFVALCNPVRYRAFLPLPSVLFAYGCRNNRIFVLMISSQPLQYVNVPDGV